MGHFYYFIGLFVFLGNLNLLINYFDFMRIKEWFKSFYKVTKKYPSNSDFKKGELDKYKRYNGFSGLNFIWFFLGLVTPSWKLFLFLNLLNAMIEVLCNLIGEFKLFSKILGALKLTFMTLMILLLVINHFHLHMDLFSWFLSR